MIVSHIFIPFFFSLFLLLFCQFQVAVNDEGKRSCWVSHSGGLSMNWILTVWSLYLSKSATHATGEHWQTSVHTEIKKWPNLSFLNWVLYTSLHRSCRLAPLIQCDYCPLLFHMDCLDPPLTALPAGKWMCPNHVEHLVVSALLLVVH